MMKILSLLIIALLFIQVYVEATSVSDATHSISQEDAGENSASLVKKHHPHKINCGRACARRCSKSSRKNVCHRACKSCCNTCHCVPPGTNGHTAVCPCYASLRTHGNKLKCP